MGKCNVRPGTETRLKVNDQYDPCESVGGVRREDKSVL